MATLGIVETLKRELPALGCPANTFAFLIGISGGRLSGYINGLATPTGPEELVMRNTLTALRELVSYADPLPLNMREARKIQDSLKAMADGTLRVILIKEDRIQARQ